jgi:hypothetical protein
MPSTAGTLRLLVWRSTPEEDSISAYAELREREYLGGA